MKAVTFEGEAFVGLPIPALPLNALGRKYTTLRQSKYIIDVYAYPLDGEPVWVAYRWDGSAWPTVPMFSRAEENRYPKTIARQASEFLTKLKG